MHLESSPQPHHRVEIPVTGPLSPDLAASVVARLAFVRPDFEVLLDFVRAERLDDVLLGAMLSTCAQGHPHTLTVRGLPERFDAMLTQLGIRTAPARRNGHGL